MLAYPVHLEPAEGGGFIVTFPDIPEVVSEGDDESEALAWGLDALETILESYAAYSLSFPS
jgi:antitoxin HicB